MTIQSWFIYQIFPNCIPLNITMVLNYEQKREVKEAVVPELEILFLNLSGWSTKNCDES